MPGKGMQRGAELDLTRFAVVPDHQPAVVVEPHLFGDPAKVPERTLQSGKPALLALVSEGPDIKPVRTAEPGDKQIDFDSVAVDQHPALAEIDLQLLAGRRLKANRRPRLRLRPASQRCHLTLDRPQAQFDTLLGQQRLAHNIGIAGMATKPLGQPILTGDDPSRLLPACRR